MENDNAIIVKEKYKIDEKCQNLKAVRVDVVFIYVVKTS